MTDKSDKTNKLLIVHISDIHFKKNKPVVEPEKVVAALRLSGNQYVSCIIAVSGDIAFSGSIDEYSMATKFFKGLISLLEKEKKCPIFFAAVPGNHDCELSVQSQARSLVCRHITEEFENAIQGELFDTMISPQGNFRCWLKEMGDEAANEFENTFIRHLELTVLSKVTKRIVLRLCNTAWMSELKEPKGKLRFPHKNIRKHENENDLIISVFHHPYSWMSDEDSLQFRRKIEENSDIILSGHEHDGETYTKNNSTVESTLYLEGAAFNSHGTSSKSAFHAVTIDIEEERHQIRTFEWAGDHFTSLGDDNPWSDYVRKKNLTKNKFRANSSFETEISDPGIQLTHPEKIVFLDDIFVPPDIEILLDAGTKKDLTRKIIRSTDFKEKMFQIKKVRFSGPSQSGKTAIGKMLFKYSKEKGLVPVIINGELFETANQNDLHKLILKCFRKQYSVELEEEYLQLPNTKRSLIIDKFARNNLTARAKIDLEHKFADFADFVYVLGSDLSEFEELIVSPDTYTADNDYTYCRVKQFGYVLRHKLIEKWLLIGRTDTLSNEERSQKVKKVEVYINKLLGKDVIPSYPIFLLVILQSVESQIELDTSVSSSGYFFDVLIKSELEKQKGTVDIDTRMNFLAEFAWKLKENDVACLAESVFLDFCESYCDEFAVKFDKKQTIREMVNSKIFKSEYDGFSFSYRYQNYYFCSLYMAKKLHDHGVQSYFDELVNTIYLEDSANILVYLSYHSRDRLIVKKLIDKANELLADHPEFNIEHDVEYINKMHSVIPDFVLPSVNDVDNRRLEALEKQDELEDEYHNDNQKEMNDVKDAFSINSASKTMHVLGQIARNYAGDMKKDEKTELVETCFSLGFRTMHMLFSSLEDSLELVMGFLSDLMTKKLEKLDQNKKEELLHTVFFWFTEILASYYVKRISHAIGSDKLIPVFDALYQDSNSLSHKMVDMTIRLDHTLKIPEQQIYKIRNACDNNLFGKTLLTLLIQEHFYMFHVNNDIRQRVCSKLEIKASDKKTIGSSNKILPTPNK